MADVLFVSNELFPLQKGGIGRLMFNFLEHYAKAHPNHRCHVLLFDQGSDEPELSSPVGSAGSVFRYTDDFRAPTADDGDWLEGLPGHYGNLVRKSYRILSMIDDLMERSALQFDVVEFPDFGGWAYAAITEKLAGRRFSDCLISVRIHSTFGMIQGDEELYHKPSDWITATYDVERYCLENADLIIGHLDQVVELNRRQYGFGDAWLARTRVEFPPILLTREEAETAAPEEGLPQTIDVVFSARLQPFKRPDLFIFGAIAFLNEYTEADVRFLIASYGWDEGYITWLKSLVPPHQNEKIRFLENIDQRERLEILSRSILVLPTTYESLCLLAYEAILRGTPLLLNSQCTAFETDALKDYPNAAYFDGTPDTFAVALRVLLDRGPFFAPVASRNIPAPDAAYFSDATLVRDKSRRRSDAAVIGQLIFPRYRFDGPLPDLTLRELEPSGEIRANKQVPPFAYPRDLAPGWVVLSRATALFDFEKVREAVSKMDGRTEAVVFDWLELADDGRTRYRAAPLEFTSAVFFGAFVSAPVIAVRTAILEEMWPKGDFLFDAHARICAAIAFSGRSIVRIADPIGEFPKDPLDGLVPLENVLATERKRAVGAAGRLLPYDKTFHAAEAGRDARRRVGGVHGRAEPAIRSIHPFVDSANDYREILFVLDGGAADPDQGVHLRLALYKDRPQLEFRDPKGLTFTEWPPRMADGDGPYLRFTDPPSAETVSSLEYLCRLPRGDWASVHGCVDALGRLMEAAREQIAPALFPFDDPQVKNIEAFIRSFGARLKLGSKPFRTSFLQAGRVLALPPRTGSAFAGVALKLPRAFPNTDIGAAFIEVSESNGSTAIQMRIDEHDPVRLESGKESGTSQHFIRQINGLPADWYGVLIGVCRSWVELAAHGRDDTGDDSADQCEDQTISSRLRALADLAETHRIPLDADHPKERFNFGTRQLSGFGFRRSLSVDFHVGQVPQDPSVLGVVVTSSPRGPRLFLDGEKTSIRLIRDRLSNPKRIELRPKRLRIKGEGSEALPQAAATLSPNAALALRRLLAQIEPLISVINSVDGKYRYDNGPPHRLRKLADNWLQALEHV